MTVNGMASYFSRHTKMRIFLQLVLDGLPVLLLLAHLLSGDTVRMYTHGWSGTYHFETGFLYDVTLICLLVIPIPAFVAGVILRDKAFEIFEQHRWCRWLSTALRIASALVVAMTLLADVLLFAAWTLTW